MQPISAPPQPVGGTHLGARIRRHTGQIARLSGPIVVGNTAVLLMEVVDTIMVGRFDTLELAFQGIASVVVFPMLICGIGYMQSTQVAVSNAYGADDLQRCGRALWLSVPVALVLGLVGTLLCLAGGPILLALGQDPEIARGGGEVVAILGLGLPAILLGVTCAGFLDGLGRPIAGMVMILLANLVNVFANWVLIYGNLGFEPMGATGSAWATVIVRWLFVPAMVLCIALLVDRRAFGLDRVGARIAAVFTAEAVAGFWRDSSFQRKIGTAFAAGMLVEAFAFEALTIYAGWLGPDELAAYSVAFRILGLIFMVSLGIAISTGIRVGIANGRGDMRDVAIASWVGLAFNFVAASIVGVIVALNAAFIAGLFTNDASLIPMIVPIIVLCGIMIPFDGGQVVAVRALRGRGDAWIPTALHAFSYGVVMLPLTWFLAIPMGRGLPGLFEGAIIASIVSVGLQCVRIALLSRADRRNSAAEAGAQGEKLFAPAKNVTN